MKNQQKGFIVPLLIIAIAALAVGVGFYIHDKNSQPAAVVSAIPPQNILNELGTMNDQITYHPGLSAYINQYYPALAVNMKLIVPNSPATSSPTTTTTK